MADFKWPKAYSALGADMGRPRNGTGTRKKCRLFEVKLDTGGYDNGGAYWGSGQKLWACLDDLGGAIAFVRARNRADAFEEVVKQVGDQISLACPTKEYG